jgi:hypothetical protein
MVNNSTNINKANYHTSPQAVERKQTKTYTVKPVYKGHSREHVFFISSGHLHTG